MEKEYDYLIVLTFDGEIHQIKLSRDCNDSAEDILSKFDIDIDACEYIWSNPTNIKKT